MGIEVYKINLPVIVFHTPCNLSGWPELDQKSRYFKSGVKARVVSL